MQTCSACRFTKYCCEGCQREDWAVHRQECPAIATAYGNHRSSKQVYYGLLDQDTFDTMHAMLDLYVAENDDPASTHANSSSSQA